MSYLCNVKKKEQQTPSVNLWFGHLPTLGGE